MSVQKHLFDTYASHYKRMTVLERLPNDIERLRRDRLPHWIHQVPLEARILDAGCGQGHLLAALYRVGYKNLSGLDISPQMIESARSLLPSEVKLTQADIRGFLAVAQPESYDVVFFHDVLEHLPREDTLDVLKGLHKILCVGGFLSVRVPNMGAIIGSYTSSIDFTHITHFTEYSLIQVVEAGGFEARKITLVSQHPRLYFSWRRPHKMFFRFLNYGRWHINNVLHKSIYLLIDMRPRPSIFDPNIVVVARK